MTDIVNSDLIRLVEETYTANLNPNQAYTDKCKTIRRCTCIWERRLSRRRRAIKRYLQILAQLHWAERWSVQIPLGLAGFTGCCVSEGLLGAIGLYVLVSWVVLACEEEGLMCFPGSFFALPPHSTLALLDQMLVKNCTSLAVSTALSQAATAPWRPFEPFASGRHFSAPLPCCPAGELFWPDRFIYRSNLWQKKNLPFKSSFVV